MKLGERLIETLRTLHHGMNLNDARLLQGSEVFDQAVLNRSKVTVYAGDPVSYWQSEIQRIMAQDRTNLAVIRERLQREADKRLQPYTFPFSRK